MRPLRRVPIRAVLCLAVVLAALSFAWPRPARADAVGASEASATGASAAAGSLEAPARPLDATQDAHAPAPSGAESDAHADSKAPAASKGQVFIDLYQHVVPHQIGPHHPLILFGLPVWTPASDVTLFGLPIYDIQAYQVLAIALIFLLFGGVAAKIRAGRPTVAGAFVQWIRDEMVAPSMGEHDSKRFTPLFCAMFFFIVIQNIVGLVPGTSTPTASIFVTASLALITFLVMLCFGMYEQGPVAYVKHLVPGGLPTAILPLMFFVELIGLIIKPFALMIRLFANMTAGHLVVLSFIGLIFYFQQQFGTAIGVVLSPVWVGCGIFIMVLESFVSLLQAFIFTQLTIMFVAASLHPEH